MNYWIEKTIVNKRQDRMIGDRALGKALWSPQRDKRGADIYKNMRKVEKGDIVLHLVDNKEFSGVSIVMDKAIEAEGIEGTNWEGPAYLVYLEKYIELIPRISRGDLLNQKNLAMLEEISEESEVFYNSNLELRQGAYLTPCPIKLLSLINNIYYNLSNKNLPHVEIPSTHMDELFLKNEIFKYEYFYEALKKSGLRYSKTLVARFIASLLTKPFVILTGLSGSGKTKLAQAFVKWICQDENQYRVIPVGADWTNREPLLGYPNALNSKEYVKPDSGVLDLIIHANQNPDLPHFLLLDEMNLSHVERYFADFLSAMESKEEIPLYSKDTVENNVPARLKVPSNLFVIGTVNIDETTYMFSPKVLDRANTIEFRITKDEMLFFLKNVKELDIEYLTGKGAPMAKSFLDISKDNYRTVKDIEAINSAMVQFFAELKKVGAEFGYRTVAEILRLIQNLTVINNELTINEKIDIAIMQKLLPKMHGSRRKLCPVLETLASFCIKGDVKIIKHIFDNPEFDFNSSDVLFPISLEKITRMYKSAIDNGFASFAEA
ncbi:MAG: hypothetical protein HPY62_01870 [Bacteroidales bacterium]|nr:hypothetical protein [Bacteroidales bacterium]